MDRKRNNESSSDSDTPRLPSKRRFLYDSDDVSSDESNNCINFRRIINDIHDTDDDQCIIDDEVEVNVCNDDLENDNQLNDQDNMEEIYIDYELPIDEEDAQLLDDIGECIMNEEREHLYDGCNLTKEEGDLLILNYSIRWNLPDAGLEDLLELINCFLPHPVLQSKYHLLKKYKNSEEYVLHFMCPECKLLVTTSNHTEYCCGSCQNKYDVHDLKLKKSYFLQMRLKPQLEEFVMNKFDILNKSKAIQGGFSNILSGTYYQKLKNCGKINENDLILQMNTDGVRLFKSSLSSLWPVQIEIANLTLREKRENTMLTSLWFGHDKPNMNTFLKPTIDELKQLHEVGINVIINDEEVNIKAHTIISSVDTPARCAMQKMTQYNGEYGCTFCYHKGKSVKVGRGGTKVYPSDNVQPLLRDLANHINHVQVAEKEKYSVYGVKGYSVLLEIPMFDIIDSCVVDYMHCVCLGVVKTLIDASLNSKYNERDFYVGNRINEIQERFDNIKPPCEVTRTPGDLVHRRNFKASEWRNIMCYYLIPLFKQILPQKYLNHWLLLVAGIRIFLKKKIQPEEHQRAENFLKEFVSQIRSLYGIEFYKYNIHLLLHIPRNVKRFGCLWDTSCFSFEHCNGVLAKMYKNSQSVPEQICKSYNRFRNIERDSNIAFSNPECPDRAKNLFKNMTSHLRLSHLCIQQGDNLRVLGVGKREELNLMEIAAIRNFLGHPFDECAIVVYNRFINQNIMWHGHDDNLLEKRNNSFAKLKNESIVLIKKIVSVTYNKNKKKMVLLANTCEVQNEKVLLAKCTKLKLLSSEIHECHKVLKKIIACHPDEIDEKCVAVPFGNLMYISTLVNNIERD
ncbi:hypothetical protein TKK_0011679 [Trichogramma kaykai]